MNSVKVATLIDERRRRMVDMFGRLSCDSFVSMNPNTSYWLGFGRQDRIVWDGSEWLTGARLREEFLGRESMLGYDSRTPASELLAIPGFEQKCAAYVGRDVAALRRGKDALEISLMQVASNAVSRSVSLAFAHDVDSDSTEVDVQFSVHRRLLESLPSFEWAFDPSVGAGASSGKLWSAPSMSPIGVGVVATDFGVKFQGYCSDRGQTWWVGPRSGSEYEEYRVAEESLNEVLREAVSEIGAGARVSRLTERFTSKASNAGLRVISRAQFGHGLGLHLHESPAIGIESDDVLIEGEVVSLEPELETASGLRVSTEQPFVVGETTLVPLDEWEAPTLT